MDKVECVVVGAGVIGLAVARRLALAGREVVVLEGPRASAPYLLAQQRGDPRRHLLPRRQPEGADLRQRQARALPLLPRARRPAPQLRQADRRDDAEEAEKLQSIRAHAEANGVDDLQLLTGEAARALEPALNCDAALLSPSTGIIDSHAYMLALQGEAEEAGAAFAFHTPLLRARAGAGRIEIEAGGDAPMTLACDLLVNAAGFARPRSRAASRACRSSRSRRPISPRATTSAAARGRRSHA